MDAYVEANRSNWDDRVAIHVASAFYDVDGWLAKGQGPRQHEIDALGDVVGLDLVHLQCHFGLDTLAFARAGARVTGVDFAPAAIAQARVLADRAGLGGISRFVEADVLDAAAALAPATFDVVYVSLGALCWLPSVDRWAAQVAALLRPGGRLYLHDQHPLVDTLGDDDDLRIEHTYFEESEPFVESGGTYTDGAGPVANDRSYAWNHSIGEIVTAIVRNGLRLDSLIEHDWTVWRALPWLREIEPHRWAPPGDRPRIPLSFTLLASRPFEAPGSIGG